MKVFEKNRALFGNARWILPDFPPFNCLDLRMHFRRKFHLESIPETAEILITADSRYTLWINGEYVNHGPARGFQEHWPFDRIDIARYLRKGENIIAVLGYQYGMSCFSYRYENASGFLLAGKAGNVDLSTGKSWKSRFAPGYYRGVAKGSNQYGMQEYYDCRQNDGWKDADYCDDNWCCSEGRPVGIMPWHSFEERGIPLLGNEILYPEKAVSASGYRPKEDYRELKNIAYYYPNGIMDWKSCARSADPAVFENGIHALVIDFGREVVGHLQFEAESDGDGDILDYLICESMTGAVPDIGTPANYYATLFGGRLILKQGKNQHELTLPWGLRYVILYHPAEYPLKVKISIRQTLYPLEKAGDFSGSDSELNRIWEISERTQRCCMTDAHIDCPWREVGQWWGDALVQAQNTFRLTADSRLFERGLRQISQQKTPDGLTYALAPNRAHSCILPDYSLMWIMTLHAHYFQTGSIRMYRELRETVDNIFGYFESMTGENGLIAADERYWLFLDWCPGLFKTGCPTLLNLLAAGAFRQAAELAALDGDAERQGKFSGFAKSLEQAIRKNLFDPAAMKLYDGLNEDGSRAVTCSPHAAATAIWLDLFPEAHDVWLKEILLPLLKSSRRHPIQPSSYFMFYVLEAVRKKGYRMEIIDCIRRWWGDYLAEGLTTTPEGWPEQMDRGCWSMCHAWSAHPLYFFSEILLGVHPVEPGWKKVVFDPLPLPGQKFSGTVPTPHGTIEVECDWTESEGRKNIRLPEGVELA